MDVAQSAVSLLNAPPSKADIFAEVELRVSSNFRWAIIKYILANFSIAAVGIRANATLYSIITTFCAVNCQLASQLTMTIASWLANVCLGPKTVSAN